MPDLNKLCKLLMLTTSVNDAEALSVIRKANQIAMEGNSSWNSIFKALNQPVSPVYTYKPYTPPTPKPPKPTPKHDTSRDWSEVIIGIIEKGKISTSTAQFLKSICEFHIENGYLTEKQATAVKKYM